MKGELEKEYCSSKGSLKYAGTQLIIEMWDGINFSSLERIEEILRDAIDACGATLLNIDLHKFSPSGGISGVAIIKESHFSIHTWPEYNYAAIDIFVCGQVDAYKAIPVLREGFKPKKIQVMELKRGVF